jgi:hypothetical protein
MWVAVECKRKMHADIGWKKCSADGWDPNVRWIERGRAAPAPQWAAAWPGHEAADHCATSCRGIGPTGIDPTMCGAPDRADGRATGLRSDHYVVESLEGCSSGRGGDNLQAMTLLCFLDGPDLPAGCIFVDR